MPNVHLTEELHGHRLTMEVVGREATCPQDPRQKDEHGRQVGGERGRGLVVGGDTQVSIELWERKGWCKP